MFVFLQSVRQPIRRVGFFLLPIYIFMAVRREFYTHSPRISQVKDGKTRTLGIFRILP